LLLRFRALILSLCFLVAAFSLPPAVSNAAEPIKVSINGEQIKMSMPPVMKDGTVMVPFRPIFEKLGLTIGWDSRSQTITGKKEGLEISLKIGRSQGNVNGQARSLSIAPAVVGSSTLVPLRFIGEATGSEVTWEKETNTVTITTPPIVLQGSPSEIKLSRGLTTKLNLPSQKIDLKRINVTWVSSNTNVATVDKEGVVTALTDGSAIITAILSDGVSVTYSVRVNGLQASDVHISKDTVSIEAGASQQLEVSIGKDGLLPEKMGYEVVWSTLDSSIAIVEKGRVSGVSAGSTIVQATVDNHVVLNCKVSVREAIVKHIDITETAIEMEAGSSRQLVTIVSPSEAKSYKIKWRSYNAAVAAVDNNGNVSAVSPGTVKIVAAIEGTSIFDEVTVIVKEKKITMHDVISSGDAKQFEVFLNQNYSSLPSALGDWNPRFQVNGSAPYELYIRIDWSGPSPLTLDEAYPDLEIVNYGRVITKEEKIQTKQLLRDFQKQIAGLAEQAFPSTRIRGEFYSGFYRYPNIRVDYNYIKFLSWSNFDKETQVKTGFRWVPADNNFNFVFDEPIRGISYYEEDIVKTYPNGSSSGKLRLKVGESKTLSLIVEPQENARLGLDYAQMGLSFITRGYYISVDKKGVVTGLKQGERGVLVSYHWNPYVTQYITVVVE